jgi:putative transposase
MIVFVDLFGLETYRSAMAQSRITPSMSRKGDCWDTAPMESLHTLKAARLHHRAYAIRAEARRDLFGYVYNFYN